MNTEHLKLKKEKLEKQLNEVSNKIDRELIKEHLPLFKEKYEGKYFKTKNTYGGRDTKPWCLYTKVVEITEQDIYDTYSNGASSYFTGWNFQTCVNGSISIETNQKSYVDHIGEEISEKEFFKAFDKMLAKINSLH